MRSHHFGLSRTQLGSTSRIDKTYNSSHRLQKNRICPRPPAKSNLFAEWEFSFDYYRYSMVRLIGNSRGLGG
jgi:hypothetical protein